LGLDPAQSSGSVNDTLVLLKFDIDLSQEINITESNVSLLVNDEGQIIANSDNNIGFRVGFFGDPNEPQDQRSGRVDNDDTVFGPIPNVKASVNEFVYRGGLAVTRDDGRYSFQFMMPICPVGGFTYTTDVTTELRYRNFLPTGAPSIPYYLRTPGYSYCYADLVPAFIAPTVIGILAATSVPNIQSNLYADVMFVIGKIELRNPMNQTVELGETTYTPFDELPDQVTQKFYDFNGDNEPDHVEQGRVFSCQDDAYPEADKLDVFVSDTSGSADESIEGYTCEDTHTAEKLKASDKGPWQGIFFDGSQDGAQDFPDLVRLIDREFRNEEIGILKSISEDDLRNTDVVMFRESTGQLILERRGLKPEEAKYRKTVDYNADENQVAYRIMLRGRNDSRLNVGGGVDRRQSFENWATEYQLTEPLRKRESDQPRPGEYIKIVAINRATGYTGTARVQLKSAGDPNKSSTTLLDVEVPTITLLPPNLKVWAERDYTVEHGLTKGEDRNYTIGNEGASLTSDTSIRVYTEWLDEEGRPLPDELGENSGKQYGLTGRLAKLVGANQLKGTAIGDDMAEFAIAPGRNTQVLKLKGQTNNTEHFYIHVIGKPKDQECVNGASCPSFDVISGQAELAGRPMLLTPFLTPLWDENESWKEYAAYRKTLEELEEALPEGGELAEADKPNKPLPSYAWQYRPEYQFSQFDFKVDAIERTITDKNGDEQVIDIFDLDNPTIASSDDYITALYSLISNEFDALMPIDGGQELVIALGEQEQRISFGQDRSIRFSNLAGLSQLDVEDFVSMRLYTNNDGGNILWEYAFESSNIGKLKEADNQCNFAFNKNHYKDDEASPLKWSNTSGHIIKRQ
jgi:hypothetical protein